MSPTSVGALLSPRDEDEELQTGRVDLTSPAARGTRSVGERSEKSVWETTQDGVEKR